MSHTKELTLIERAEAVDLCDEPLIAWVERVELLTKQRDDLLAAIETTLSENGHLADGENCTLITLKRAVASVKEK